MGTRDRLAETEGFSLPAGGGMEKGESQGPRSCVGRSQWGGGTLGGRERDAAGAWGSLGPGGFLLGSADSGHI